MDKIEYERKKEELKARKARAARELEQARGGKSRAYAVAVNKYTAAQEALNEFIKEHSLKPQPTREERRTEKLRSQGITPVWDRDRGGTPNPHKEKFVSASGESICKACCRKYYAHPPDLDTLDNQNRPFLKILCNGLRVKL